MPVSIGGGEKRLLAPPFRLVGELGGTGVVTNPGARDTWCVPAGGGGAGRSGELCLPQRGLLCLSAVKGPLGSPVAPGRPGAEKGKAGLGPLRPWCRPHPKSWGGWGRGGRVCIFPLPDCRPPLPREARLGAGGRVCSQIFTPLLIFK